MCTGIYVAEVPNETIILFAQVWCQNTNTQDHKVATTIIKWQLSDALLNKSGATRARWDSENGQGGNMCST